MESPSTKKDDLLFDLKFSIQSSRDFWHLSGQKYNFEIFMIILQILQYMRHEYIIIIDDYAFLVG